MKTLLLCASFFLWTGELCAEEFVSAGAQVHSCAGGDSTPAVVIWAGDSTDEEHIQPAEADNAGNRTEGPEEPEHPAGKDSSDEYYSPEEFTFAGRRYYTITGGTALKETSLQTVPAIVVAAGYAGIVTTLHIIQSSWWQGKRNPIRFEEDWPFARQVDKAGHTYSGYFASYWWSHALMESGLSWDAATWTGAALGLAYQTYVEIYDGMADGWGFSPSDQYANMFGAGLFVAQRYVPFLQNFIPKWQYVPADWTNTGFSRRQNANFIDDYNSSSFWLGINAVSYTHLTLPTTERG